MLLTVTELVLRSPLGLNFKTNCSCEPVPVNVSVSSSSVTTYVLEILSNLIAILLDLTTSLSITTAARAATPSTDSPPSIIIVGALR